MVEGILYLSSLQGLFEGIDFLEHIFFTFLCVLEHRECGVEYGSDEHGRKENQEGDQDFLHIDREILDLHPSLDIES